MQGVSEPYNIGSKAPPAIAMMSSADPVFVWRPKPKMASGKIAGHISELARLNKVKHQMDVLAGRTAVHIPRITPRMAQ